MIGNWTGNDCNTNINGNSSSTAGNGTGVIYVPSSPPASLGIGVIIGIVLAAIAVIGVGVTVVAVLFARNRRLKVVFKDPKYESVVFGKYLSLLYEGNYPMVEPLKQVRLSTMRFFYH